MRQGHRGTPQGRGQLPPAHDCWGPSPSRVPELPRRERAELEADPDAATQKHTTPTWTDLGVGRWHVIEGRKTFGLLMYVGRRVSVGDGGLQVCRGWGGLAMGSQVRQASWLEGSTAHRPPVSLKFQTREEGNAFTLTCLCCG